MNYQHKTTATTTSFVFCVTSQYFWSYTKLGWVAKEVAVTGLVYKLDALPVAKQLILHMVYV